MRDLGALESALAHPRVTFEGSDLDPSVAEKAAALGFSLIANHPVRGRQQTRRPRCMEVFLILNGHELSATVEDSERVILGVVAGTISRGELVPWVQLHALAL